MLFKSILSKRLLLTFTRQKPNHIQRIFPHGLSPAIGPYSPVTISNNTVYISGQLPLTSQGVIESNDIKQQAHQVMKNLQIALTAADCSFSDVAKTTILLTDMGNFAIVNQVYGQYFLEGQYPARACYAVKQLPKGSLIEIQAIAYKALQSKVEYQEKQNEQKFKRQF